MITDENFKSIQVFHIGRDSFVGVATDLNTSGYRLLHSAAGDINGYNVVTFTFQDDSTKSVNMVMGEDIGFNRDCKSITSTKDIWVS